MSVFPVARISKWGYHKGNGTRWFGAPRDDGRIHAGCDLLARPGTKVLAIDHGTVQYRADFYLGTDQLVVKHGNFIVRYGEVAKDKKVKGIKNGSVVKPGDVIAYVGRLKMLHFEMYQGTETGYLTRRKNKDYKFVDPKNYQRRADLIDPTPYLDAWKAWSQFSDWIDDVMDDYF